MIRHRPLVALSHWTAALAAASLATLGAATVASAAAQQPPTCGRPDTITEDRWKHVAGGWLGGDGVFSLPLPTGNTLWRFADSLVGVGSEHLFVRGTAVLERPTGLLSTLAANRRGRPFLSPPGNAHERWMWPSSGVVTGSAAWLFTSEIRAAPAPPWGFQFVRTWLAQLDARSLRLRELRRVPRRQTGVQWGATIIRQRRWLYIFGVHDVAGRKHVHLARAAVADPRGPWQYRAAGRWSTSPTHGSSWLDGRVASQFSIVRAGGGFALITHAPSLQPNLRAYWAPSLFGPWRLLGKLYDTNPPTGYHSYNALAHPDVAGPGLLVSYSIAPDVDPYFDIAFNPQFWRPRFARIRPSCLAPPP